MYNEVSCLEYKPKLQQFQDFGLHNIWYKYIFQKS